MDLYIKLHEVRRNETNVDSFKVAIDAFNDVVRLVYSAMCLSDRDWLDLFCEIQVLRNMYWSVLKDIYDDKELNKVLNPEDWDMACRAFKMLKVYTEENKIAELKDSKYKAAVFFSSDKIPTLPATLENYYKNISFLSEQTKSLNQLIAQYPSLNLS